MSSREGRVRLGGDRGSSLSFMYFIYCAVTGIRNQVFSPTILQLSADEHEILGESCLSVTLIYLGSKCHLPASSMELTPALCG